MKKQQGTLHKLQEEWRNFEEMEQKEKSLRDSTPFHLHVGMRTAKTVFAVFLCGVFGWLMKQPPLFSMFAAVLCNQNQSSATIKASINRLYGTLIGGCFSVVFVSGSWALHMDSQGLVYYSLLSFTILPLILTTLYLRKPATTSSACIAFLAISLSEIYYAHPLLSAGWRLVNTLLGITIVIVIELCFPYRPAPKGTTSETRKSV